MAFGSSPDRAHLFPATGFVGGGQSKSDKKIGVVALSMFDLRRRGKVADLSMVGTTGQ